MANEPKLIAEQTVRWYSPETPPEHHRDVLLILNGRSRCEPGYYSRGAGCFLGVNGTPVMDDVLAWSYGDAPEIPEEEPEEVEEDDCTDCCKALPVYDFSPAPSRHQQAAEEMQEEWEREEEER